MLGCLPLCPGRLVYPEYVPKACLWNTPNQLFKKIKVKGQARAGIGRGLNVVVAYFLDTENRAPNTLTKITHNNNYNENNHNNNNNVVCLAAEHGSTTAGARTRTRTDLPRPQRHVALVTDVDAFLSLLPRHPLTLTSLPLPKLTCAVAAFLWESMAPVFESLLGVTAKGTAPT